MRAATYDQLTAEAYDGLFSDEASRAEDAQAVELVRYDGERVVDIGCGTGLFLDNARVDAGDYVGVDPSQRMVDGLLRRHPGFEVRVETFERFAQGAGQHNGLEFDLAVGLFGSPSYIAPANLILALRRCLAPWGRFALMFFAPGYPPVTHKHLERVPAFWDSDGYKALPGERTRVGNFVMVTGAIAL